MSFIEVIQTYFRGEKSEALFFILTIGIALTILGVVALKAESGGFAWGVAIPSFLFGLVLMGTGIGVAWHTDGQIAEIKKGYENEPTAMVQKDSAEFWDTTGSVHSFETKPLLGCSSLIYTVVFHFLNEPIGQTPQNLNREKKTPLTYP